MAFLQEVGNFFQGIGEGVTSTVQGFGANIESQAALNNAQAAAIMAAAQTTEARIYIEAEEKKRRDRLIMVLVIIIVAAPLAGMAIYYGLKK